MPWNSWDSLWQGWKHWIKTSNSRGQPQAPEQCQLQLWLSSYPIPSKDVNDLTSWHVIAANIIDLETNLIVFEAKLQMTSCASRTLIGWEIALTNESPGFKWFHLGCSFQVCEIGFQLFEIGCKHNKCNPDSIPNHFNVGPMSEM